MKILAIKKLESFWIIGCKLLQRILDIFFSATAIIVFSPIFLLTMFILKFSGEGEIFFRQPRVGKYQKTIHILKFATMLKNSPNIGTGTVTLKNDPRVLPFGKFLRKSKINELPQLINILAGEMSVIGPRPQTIRCFEAFPEKSQLIISKVRPGLSGIGSIFFRNEEEMLSQSESAEEFYNQVIMPFKGELEEWYVANSSLFLYFALIFYTIWVVVTGTTPLKIFGSSDLPKAPEKLARFFHP